MHKRLLLVVTLGLLQTISTLTIDIYLPAFPQISAEFSASQAAVQFTFTGAMIGSLIGQLVAGPWSDRVGRRLPLLVACILHVTASLACAMAPSAEWLAGARFFLGLAAAATGVMALSMVRDLYRGGSMVKMLGNMALISGVAIAVGPLLGSQLLQLMPWRGVFVTLACYSLFLCVFAAFALGETLPAASRHPTGRGRLTTRIAHVVSDRVYVGLVLVSAFMWAGMFSYLAASSFLFQSVFGLTATEYGLVFASHALLMLAGNQLSARLGGRIGYGTLISITTFGTAASTLAMLLLHDQGGLFSMLVPLWAFTFFLGAGTPIIQALALSRHSGSDAGTAASGLGASRQGLGAIASPIAGVIGITGILPVASVMVVAQLVAVVLLWVIIRPWQRLEM
jgi:DHA1 family bicyclomycin/chloramphenicol resistance-like MFS transporter